MHRGNFGEQAERGRRPSGAKRNYFWTAVNLSLIVIFRAQKWNCVTFPSMGLGLLEWHDYFKLNVSMQQAYSFIDFMVQKHSTVHGSIPTHGAPFKPFFVFEAE